MESGLWGLTIGTAFVPKPEATYLKEIEEILLLHLTQPTASISNCDRDINNLSIPPLLLRCLILAVRAFLHILRVISELALFLLVYIQEHQE
jgi:hypothetical protein